MNGKNLIIHETNGLKYGYRKEGNPGLKPIDCGGVPNLYRKRVESAMFQTGNITHVLIPGAFR